MAHIRVTRKKLKSAAIKMADIAISGYYNIKKSKPHKPSCKSLFYAQEVQMQHIREFEYHRGLQIADRQLWHYLSCLRKAIESETELVSISSQDARSLGIIKGEMVNLTKSTER